MDCPYNTFIVPCLSFGRLFSLTQVTGSLLHARHCCRYPGDSSEQDIVLSMCRRQAIDQKMNKLIADGDSGMKNL